MIWVIKRVLVLWLTLAAICAAVIGMGRLNPAPDVLQTLGFAVCDGDPCFRGIKVGMTWDDAQRNWPPASGVNDPSNNYTMAIVPSGDGKIVWQIWIENEAYPSVTPISLGNVIAEYGAPCWVRIFRRDGLPGDFYLQFRGFVIEVVAKHSEGDQGEFRLQQESPLIEAIVKDKNDPASCNTSDPGGTWSGFTSTDLYFEHFRREIAAQGP